MTLRAYHLLVFTLFLLACSVTSLEPAIVIRAATPSVTSEETAEKPVTSPTNSPKIADVTAIQSLNVRQRAGEHERVIGALYHGDQVTLTGNCAKGWAEIVWKDGTAWVNADYLSENKCRDK